LDHSPATNLPSIEGGLLVHALVMLDACACADCIKEPGRTINAASARSRISFRLVSSAPAPREIALSVSLVINKSLLTTRDS
jgi:hypothetical protein